MTGDNFFLQVHSFERLNNMRSICPSGAHEKQANARAEDQGIRESESRLKNCVSTQYGTFARTGTSKNSNMGAITVARVRDYTRTQSSEKRDDAVFLEESRLSE